MVDREKILGLLRMRGPLVPNDIKKALGGDNLIFGAMLSELASRGQVKISALKKGGSPFYYLPGQEAKLEQFIDFHNPKDQKTIHFLKQEKVVRDGDLELFERVSLRQIKDFAKELKLTTQAGEQLFWRYYLVSKDDAIRILNERHAPKKPEPKVEDEFLTVKEEPKLESVPQVKQVTQPKPEEQTPKVEPEKEQVVETTPEPKPAPAKVEEKPSEHTKPASENQSKLSASPSLEETPFYKEVISFFRKQEITLLSEEQISKDREYEFTIEVPSAVGSLIMYCRARNKKKLNEGDVAPALLKAKTKDLSCLFLTNGAFTKKSLDLIEKEYKGVLLKFL